MSRTVALKDNDWTSLESIVHLVKAVQTNFNIFPDVFRPKYFVHQ